MQSIAARKDSAHPPEAAHLVRGEVRAEHGAGVAEEVAEEIVEVSGIYHSNLNVGLTCHVSDSCWSLIAAGWEGATCQWSTTSTTPHLHSNIPAHLAAPNLQRARPPAALLPGCQRTHCAAARGKAPTRHGRHHATGGVRAGQEVGRDESRADGKIAVELAMTVVVGVGLWVVVVGGGRCTRVGGAKGAERQVEAWMAWCVQLGEVAVIGGSAPVVLQDLPDL